MKTHPKHLNTRTDPFSRGSRSGQALAEMVVGLVGILVLFALILQLGQLGRAHLESLTQARAGAGEDAMNPTFQTPVPGPRSIRNWDAGDDGSRYSQDDSLVSGSSSLYEDALAPVIPVQDLTDRISGHPFETTASDSARQALFLVAEEEDSEEIDILPILQHLIYSADSITLESQVWMTWLRGLQ